MNPAALRELERNVGYTFKASRLLELAVTHPSVAHEQGMTMQTNQRLEFLGDAVLQLVLTTELFQKFPELEEGPLTKARAKMVNRSTLSEQARLLQLGQFLRLSRGEEASGGRERPSALADAYEAILGAIFLDGGFESAREVILRQFHSVFDRLAVVPVLENPKGELQEILQANSLEAPQYHVVSVTGPDHDRSFVCTVHHAGRELARGQGRSKKAAESEAATAALNLLRTQEIASPTS